MRGITSLFAHMTIQLEATHARKKHRRHIEHVGVVACAGHEQKPPRPLSRMRASGCAQVGPCWNQCKHCLPYGDLQEGSVPHWETRPRTSPKNNFNLSYLVESERFAGLHVVLCSLVREQQSGQESVHGHMMSYDVMRVPRRLPMNTTCASVPVRPNGKDCTESWIVWLRTEENHNHIFL